MLWVLIRIASAWYSLESPQNRLSDSNEYPQHMFLWRNKQKYPLIITKIIPSLSVWKLRIVTVVLISLKVKKLMKVKRHLIPKIRLKSSSLASVFIIIEPPHDKTNKMTVAPSEDSDKPGHLPSLSWVFTVHMKKPWVLSYPLSAQWRLWSDWVDTQADLSLCWAHMSFCRFCHAAAHLIS